MSELSEHDQNVAASVFNLQTIARRYEHFDDFISYTANRLIDEHPDTISFLEVATQMVGFNDSLPYDNDDIANCDATSVFYDGGLIALELLRMQGRLCELPPQVMIDNSMVEHIDKNEEAQEKAMQLGEAMLELGGSTLADADFYKKMLSVFGGQITSDHVLTLYFNRGFNFVMKSFEKIEQDAEINAELEQLDDEYEALLASNL